MSYQVHDTCQIPGITVIFEKVFGPDYVGSFVEVGAFDGMHYGCTWGLANAGWKGTYIEAHPDFAKQCIKVHSINPKVEVIPVACGPFDGELDLIVFGACSTGKLSKWNREWQMDENTPKIKVPMKRLDSLIKEPFDLLVVDVEEMEIEVLKGFELERYNPKLAVIELHEKQGIRMDQKGWQTPWVDNYFRGYRKIYADMINTVYERKS